MILDTIVERKKEEVSLLSRDGIKLPQSFQDKNIASPRGFKNALVQYQGVAIIAEAKKASPSKGVICEDFQVDKIVKNYQENGAQALSVLTDVDFFQGSLENMMIAREHSSLPVIRKDFIIDELQVKEASVCGADAILLIAAILDVVQIQDYFQYARELGMDVLLEVHDEKELEKSLQTDCDLIGINNRNLNDFTVDINTTFRLKKEIPHSIPVVSESGLKDRQDMEKLLENKIDAALIGETLMRAGMNGSVLQQLHTN